jgi:Rrf2 family transcriptional regulator, nitric oxide-sensitive transcriptional repressor
MNKINRKVEYALMGLKHMRAKAPGELTTAKEISSLYGCPFDVMSRVLQTLAKKGVVRSEQGAHGGYQITKDLSRVSFYELNEMILGPVVVARCLHDESGESPCEIRETCNIVSPVNALNRKLVEFYKSLSLSELLEPRQIGGARSGASRTAAAAASEFLSEIGD